jgi:hypothetical protein
VDIGEAYFHLSPFEIDYDSLPKLGEQLSRIARERAENSFQFETTLEIELGPGGLKGWIAVNAAITLFAAVSQYSDFKKSIHEISIDSKWFAQEVNETFFSSINVAPRQVFRKERRTKSVGRIDRLLNRIEVLEHSCKMDGRTPTTAEVKSVETLYQLVNEDLTPEEIDLIYDRIHSPSSPLAPQMPLSKYIILPRAPKIEKILRTKQVDVSSGPPTYEIRGSMPSLSKAIIYRVPAPVW